MSAVFGCLQLKGLVGTVGCSALIWELKVALVMMAMAVRCGWLRSRNRATLTPKKKLETKKKVKFNTVLNLTFRVGNPTCFCCFPTCFFRRQGYKPTPFDLFLPLFPTFFPETRHTTAQKPRRIQQKHAGFPTRKVRFNTVLNLTFFLVSNFFLGSESLDFRI